MEMELSHPIDFQVLEVLVDTGHNVVPNIALITGQQHTDIEARLKTLTNYRLVHEIGPADYSGLYRITAHGRAVLAYQGQYDDVKDFDALISEFLHDDYIESSDSVGIDCQND